MRASESGRALDRYRSLWSTTRRLERGLAQGSLVRDTRLRDALRESSARTAIAPSDVGAIAEEAGVRDADVVRLHRRLDGLGVRVSALEGRLRQAGLPYCMVG